MQIDAAEILREFGPGGLALIIALSCVVNLGAFVAIGVLLARSYSKRSELEATAEAKEVEAETQTRDRMDQIALKALEQQAKSFEQVQELMREIAILKERNGRVEATLEENQRIGHQAWEGFKTSLSVTDNALKQVQTEKSALEIRLKEAEEKNNALSQRIGTLEHDFSQAKIAVDAERDIRHQIEDERDELKVANETLTKEVDAVKTKLTEAQAEIARLKQRIEILERGTHENHEIPVLAGGAADSTGG